MLLQAQRLPASARLQELVHLERLRLRPVLSVHRQLPLLPLGVVSAPARSNQVDSAQLLNRKRLSLRSVDLEQVLQRLPPPALAHSVRLVRNLRQAALEALVVEQEHSGQPRKHLQEGHYLVGLLRVLPSLLGLGYLELLGLQEDLGLEGVYSGPSLRRRVSDSVAVVDLGGVLEQLGLLLAQVPLEGLGAGADLVSEERSLRQALSVHYSEHRNPRNSNKRNCNIALCLPLHMDRILSFS